MSVADPVAIAHLHAIIDQTALEWPGYRFVWPTPIYGGWYNLGTTMGRYPSARVFIGLPHRGGFRLVPNDPKHSHEILSVGIEVLTYYNTANKTAWRVLPAIESQRISDGERNVTSVPSAAYMTKYGVRMEGIGPAEWRSLLSDANHMAKAFMERWNNLMWDRALTKAEESRARAEAKREQEERNRQTYEEVMGHPWEHSPAGQAAARRREAHTRRSLRNTSGGQSGGTGAQVKRPAGLRKTTGEWLEVVPAFGRDYHTAAEAKSAWYSGKDWLIASSFHRFSGKPINMEQAQEANYRVILRFDGNHKTTGT